MFKPTLTVRGVTYSPQPPDRHANQTLIAIIEKDKFLWRIDGRTASWVICDQAGRSLGKFRSKRVALMRFKREDILPIEAHWVISQTNQWDIPLTCN